MSDFIVEAAERSLHRPDRRAAARVMDEVRASVTGRVTVEDLRAWRDEERRR